jgi:ketosteroid isomerase-like protein
MIRGDPDGAGVGQEHPNAGLVKTFYQAQAAFYAGGEDTESLCRLLADDVTWHVPGRSPIAGHYRGLTEVLGYFTARRARAKATFRVRPRVILADDEWVLQLADGQLERDGQLRHWRTVGIFRIVGVKIAECWLVPFDQSLFDELWS